MKGEELKPSQALVDSLEQKICALRKMLVEAVEAKAAAEQDVLTQRARYEELTQRVPWAVVRIRPDGTYVDANHYFCNLIGQKKRDILDQKIGTRGEPPEWTKAVLDIEGGDAKEIHMPIKGEDHYFLIKKYQDRVSRYVSVLAIDQTERTKALSEAQRQAERADTANRAKSQFLAVISHEIRTPMNGILGMADMLEGTSLSEQQTHWVQTILSSGTALSGLIDNILDFTKIEDGAIELQSRKFNPEELLAQVANMFSAEASVKNLKVLLQKDLNTPKYVIGDALRIQQVLSSLISNAIKFTEQGNIVLSIGGSSSPNHWMLEYQIKDSGIGIESDRISEIFKAFNYTDTQFTRHSVGSGLGLTIVGGLVKLMKGQVSVQSTPGRGSIFTVQLPLLVAEEEVQKPKLSKRALSNVHLRNALLGHHILVAEDNEVNQQVVTAFLKRLGCTVYCAENGLAAIEALTQDPDFDLILMDIDMPVMDGISATTAIRQGQGHRANIPIVALTANAMMDHKRLCLDAGMNDFLTKPVTTEQLYQALKLLLIQDKSPDST